MRYFLYINDLPDNIQSKCFIHAESAESEPTEKPEEDSENDSEDNLEDQSEDDSSGDDSKGHPEANSKFSTLIVILLTLILLQLSTPFQCSSKILRQCLDHGQISKFNAKFVQMVQSPKQNWIRNRI